MSGMEWLVLLLGTEAVVIAVLTGRLGQWWEFVCDVASRLVRCLRRKAAR